MTSAPPASPIKPPAFWPPDNTVTAPEAQLRLISAAAKVEDGVNEALAKPTRPPTVFWPETAPVA